MDDALALEVAGLVCADRHGDVDVAGPQRDQRVLGLHQRHRELDGGVELGEAGDGERHDRAGHRLERAHPEAPAAQAGDRLELGLGLGEPREDPLGVAHHGLAGVGEPHAARAALDEDGAGLALERGDLLRDGRLRERERFGGGGERALEGDLAQDAHAADVEHQCSL